MCVEDLYNLMLWNKRHAIKHL